VSAIARAEAERLVALDTKLRAEADQMLAESGLGTIIAEAGYEAMGSYAMRTMTWRDLDFERIRGTPNWGDHWDLGRKLAETRWPWRQVCVDCYRDPRDPRGNSFYWGLRVSFPRNGPTWKLDLHTARASDFAPGRELRSNWLANLTDEARLHILAIKDAVWDRPEYRHTLFSVHIYEAVLDHGVRGLDAFMDWWRGREDDGA
jgi:hypothetical protein